MTEHIEPLVYHALVEGSGGDAWFINSRVEGPLSPSETGHDRLVVVSESPGLRHGWAGHNKNHLVSESWSPDGEWYGWWHDDYQVVPLSECSPQVKRDYWGRQEINPLHKP